MIIWGQIRLTVTGVWVGLQHSEGWILQQGRAGGLPWPGIRPWLVLLLLMMAAFRRRVFARPHPLVTILIRSVISLWKISIWSLGDTRGLLTRNLLWRNLLVFVTQTTLSHHTDSSSIVRQAGARLRRACVLSPALDQSKDVSVDFMGLLIIFLIEFDIPQSIGDRSVFLWFGPCFFQFCLFSPLRG